jgi:glycine hydroxymethyltransferase
LALIDLRGVGVTGRDAETRCDAARITLNKNAIPFDPEKPMVASGVRVGTPSVTTQGMASGQMKDVASLIGRAVRADLDTESGRADVEQVAGEVSALVAKFPAYPEPSA